MGEGSQKSRTLTDAQANKYLVPPVLDGGRIMGMRPTRAVTKEEIETFWRDGVVKLEGILPVASAEFLADCFEDIFNRPPKDGGKARSIIDHGAMADKVEESGETSRLLADGGYHDGTAKRTGRYMTEANCYRWHTDYQRYCSQGPLPEAIAQLLGTKRLKYYNDHCFYKEAGSLLRTGFHQDSAFGVLSELRGEQVAICWVPCDVVTKDSGAMGYVRGSHRGPTHAPKDLLTNADSQPMAKLMPKDMPWLPDIEGNEKDYDIIYHDAKPGDVVVHHNNTIHGSAGNTSTERHRRAASIRYIGEDVTHTPMKVHPLLGGKAYDPMAKPDEKDASRTEWKSKDVAGKELEGGMYPQVWPRVEARL